MRPLHLRIDAFGPYPDSVEIDFRRLAEQGLFVVSGATGAGKTSIFDAMTFAMFGRLAGHRSAHRAIKSEHANDDQMCTLELEFAIRDERWRVTRQPRQHRTKARGTGTTEVAPTALLERFDGVAWVGTVSKVSEVDAAVRELVGLDADKFQRVVLLPQGQFQEVLLASTDERKKLLRTLFGTERFEQVQDEIKKQAAAAREATAEIERRRTHLLDESADALDTAEATIAAAELAEGELPLQDDAAVVSAVATPTSDGDEPTNHVSERAADGPAQPDELQQRSRTLRDGGLASLTVRSASARDAANEAELRRAQAAETNSAIADQAAAKAALAALVADADGHRQRQARIAAARRAVAPIEAHRFASQAAEKAAAAADTASQRWRDAHTMLRDPLCAVQTHDPSEINSLLAHAREQAQRYQAEVDRAVERTEALATAQRFQREASEARTDAEASDATLQQLAADVIEITALIEASQRAAAQLAGLEDQASRSKNRARTAGQLVEAMTSGRTHAQALAELISLVGKLDEQASQRAMRRSSLQPLAAELVARTAQLDEAVQRSQLHRLLTQLTSRLPQAEQESRAASAEHDRCFGAYVAQAAPRLAADLRDGVPCAVCGSTDHPNPAALDAAATTGAVDTDQLAETQTAAASAAERLATLRTKIENHLEQLGPTAQLSPEQVDDQERAATHAVAEANEAVARLEALDAEEQAADLDRQAHIVRVEAARSDLSANIHEVVRLGGTLTDLAASSDAEAAPNSDGPSPDLLVTGYRAALERVTESTTAAADPSTGDAAAAAEKLANIIGAAHRLAEVVQREADAHSSTLVEAERLAREGAAHQQRLAAITDQRQALADAITQKRDAAQKLDGQADQATRHAEQLSGQLTVDDPAAARDAWGRSVDALEQAQRALANSEAASEAKAAADAALTAALADAGFATVDDLLAAAVAAAQLEELVEMTEEWESKKTVLEERVANFAAANLPDEPLDLAALDEAARRLDTRARAINSDATKAALQLDRADKALRELVTADAESESTRQNALEWHQLEQTCSGKNPANIDLESWVLATYLERVVDLANAHLRPMTRGRYELQISTSGSRVIRRGLDLEAFDRSSGTARPVVTLSGGETFMASLALALGLADAVTSARGGMQLDALFVDEGFGSLDGDTLDAAIEVLDGLRSAGTMVGLITHVPAMKEALPVAIEVAPAPTGGGSVVRQLL